MATATPTTGSRRAFFGFFDADGWAWAGVKAAIWFVAIIMLLGYIPDRAYYFTVNKTLDLGILAWSPVNLCPGENRGLPCPVPAGAIVPWEPSPGELSLPEGRADGAAVQLGKYLLYVGGDNGSGPTATTFVATLADGSFGRWDAGPALPEARSHAGIAVLSGVAYLVGGTGPDGKPVDTVWSLTTDPDSGALGTWTPVDAARLPARLSGAATLAVSDGLLIAGGTNADGKVTTGVWKATLSKDGKLGAFAAQPDLIDGVSGAAVAFDAGYVWVVGGNTDAGPVGAVQRATYGAAPAASGQTAVEGVQKWGVADSVNLPAARAGGAGFAANGTLYYVGGSDGSSPSSQVYWAVPNASGDFAGWTRLDATDLPAGGLTGASAVVSGSQVFVLGGTTASGLLTSSIRANLAPQPPFFQLGLVGATVPALQLPGEVGQQIGYLNAAGVGGADFVLLLLLGWAFNHKAQVRAFVDRRRGRRAA
jgi:N-acetylneuraminic acid mutarotase